MKNNLLILTLIITTLISCNKDNDSEYNDSFIGKWSYIQYFKNGVEQPLDECYKNNNVEIRENGTSTMISYDLDQTCEQLVPITGSWENLGNSNYKFTYDNGLEPKTNKITFEGDTFLNEFMDDGNTKIFVYQRLK